MSEATMRIPSPFTTGLLASTVVFLFLATGAVILRVYASRKVAKDRTWTHPDLWLVIAALVFCYGYTIGTVCGCALVGIDYFRSDLSPAAASVQTLKILFTDFFTTIPASALVKISILEFYRRIFVTKFFRWTCFVLDFLIVAWTIGTIFAQIFATTPVSAAWDTTIQAAHKNFDYPTFSSAVFGIDLALDVIVLCLPVFGVAKLHLSTEKKLKIYGIFLLGSFCVICAIVRLYYNHKSLTLVYADPAEETSLAAGVALWGRLEPTASIIAACLPTYGPIFPTGRALGSMVRSVSSKMSLGSIRRDSTNSSKSDPTRLGSVPQIKAGEHSLSSGDRGHDSHELNTYSGSQERAIHVTYDVSVRNETPERV